MYLLNLLYFSHYNYDLQPDFPQHPYFFIFFGAYFVIFTGLYGLTIEDFLSVVTLGPYCYYFDF